MRMRRLALVAPLALLFACDSETEDPPIPLEISYTFSMQAGRMCIPSQAHTGASPDETPAPVPVRFETCLYRCVDDGAYNFLKAWSCEGGDCTYELVPTAELSTISNELDCDERDLADPPEGECYMKTWDFNISPPVDNNGEFVVRTYTMHLPYLTFEQTAELVAIEEANGLLPSLEQIVGNQIIREREIDVDFDPSHPELTHDDLTDADCIDVEIPDFAMME